MLNEYYPFSPIIDDAHFFFRSEGQEGIIFKIVALSPTKQGRWNLGFGDFDGVQINDAVMTNNHDAAKVMRTVARIAYDYLEKYPNKIIYIEPVDERRKKFYNAVFQRYYKEMQPIFNIFGLTGNDIEEYLPSKVYDFFELKLKSGI